MVLLSLYRSLGGLLALFIFAEGSGVAFFNPISIGDSQYKAVSKLDYFIASDPISLYGMFHDWDGDYHPKSGMNVALQDMRLDLGVKVDPYYYVGYFYRYNVYIDAGKDFTDFFYLIKNHQNLDPERTYRLDLDIEGIEQSGVVLSLAYSLVDQVDMSLKFGIALSLSKGIDMQDGIIRGEAMIPNQKSYYASGDISSYYTHNYLYDLDVDPATGYGYGTDFALAYTNKEHHFDIALIINDLLSRVYWHDLPYSMVTIETDNRSYDEEEYVHYDPSISGRESTQSFVQKISPRYHVEVSHHYLEDFSWLVGIDYLYSMTMPYVEIEKEFGDHHSFLCSYESRFESFGLKYRYKNIDFGLRFDTLKEPSVLGISLSVNFLDF